MKEKKTIEISLSALLLVIAIMAVIFMAIYFYIDKVNSNKEIAALKSEIANTSTSTNVNKENVELKLGNYTVNEINTDEDMPSNEDCGVRLLENNKFEIYMGFGAWHKGAYEIKDNNLICKSVSLEWDGGAGAGERKTDVTFTFGILTSNKLELKEIDINDKDNDNLIYKEGLSVGMTYSIK